VFGLGSETRVWGSKALPLALCLSVFLIVPAGSRDSGYTLPDRYASCLENRQIQWTLVRNWSTWKGQDAEDQSQDWKFRLTDSDHTLPDRYASCLENRQIQWTLVRKWSTCKGQEVEECSQGWKVGLAML
jgi:hypothetical protein